MYKLLIVDDEPLVRNGMVHLIDYTEFSIETVYEAGDGIKAWELVTEVEPDFILCDINMPKLNGLDFAQKVKETYPWIRIAMITGYDSFDYAKQAVKCGVEDYVLKPVSRKDVMQTLGALIDKHEQEKDLKKAYDYMRHHMQENQVEDSTGYKAQLDGLLSTYLMDSSCSLTLFAEKTGLSNSHLSAVFKQIYGMPFSEYIVKERLEKARFLLLTTAMKNYEIADAVGFEDPNYFSTAFKKHYDESPRQYRQGHRG